MEGEASQEVAMDEPQGARCKLAGQRITGPDGARRERELEQRRESSQVDRGMECSCSSSGSNCSRVRMMKGLPPNNCTGELIQRIEELREEREEMKAQVQVEEEEKASIQKDLVVLTKRLAEIDDSLSRKYAFASNYDKTIEEVEAAYGKILESSQALLHVLKTETIQISNKRMSPTRERSNSFKRLSVPNDLPF
ncbi:hypothetical protein GOP47_0030035 [Adiantum capillus-veneris]|nr:hypothetical protein GOP47_0030035 [Adiantum capillus-veneris]